MFDFASQIGAFIGTSFILFIATKPKRERRDSDPILHTTNCFKGAKKYSREGRRQSSFGMHDDFEM